ncbi:MAG: hypothetical protein IJJ26_11925 [Victivallales bacterium]|nr:hypothetical protein [Victivallales bacterium]
MTQGTSKSSYSEQSSLAWLVIALAVYLVRVTPWLLSEFWYDEVLTLGNFAMDVDGRGLWTSVFRSYPIANNHILNSAIYWLWVRVLNFGLDNEQLVRLPSLIFGGATIAIVVCHWRRWIGDVLADIGGLLMAISPVFTAFAYQVRGYSLSMFLATIALSGALEHMGGHRLRGQVLMCVSCLLLPLVIPSNFLFVFALATAIAIYASLEVSADGKRSFQWRGLLAGVPALLCGALGSSYYLTLWESFKRAAQEPAGWSSAWLAFLHVPFAFAVHALVLLAILFWPHHPHKDAETENAPSCTVDIFSPQLVFAGVSVLLLALVILFGRAGHAPYPRVFLVFWPGWTLGVMLSLRQTGRDTRMAFPVMALLVLGNGFLWERGAQELTRQALARNVSPCNLLQQYYRGTTGIRNSIELLHDEQWMQGAIVLTDEYDLPTANMYWMLHGGDQGAVLGPNRTPQGFWNELNHSQIPRLWVIAKSPEAAANLFEHAGFGKSSDLLEQFGQPGGMSRVILFSDRAVYAPPGPNVFVPKQRKRHSLI